MTPAAPKLEESMFVLRSRGVRVALALSVVWLAIAASQLLVGQRATPRDTSAKLSLSVVLASPGSLTSTVGRTVGLGTNRQMQFALRFIF